jgi:hypothetical protein
VTATVPRSGGLIRTRQATGIGTDPAPVDPSASWRPRSSRDSLRLVRSHAATDAADADPATLADISRLETVLGELIHRDDQRAEALARIEAGLLSLLDDVTAIRARLHAEDHTDRV